jgi:hypothetical protein
MNDLDLNKKLINLMESSMSEAAKPDYIDLDKDGDKKEPMKKAAKDKKKMDEAEDKDGKMPSKSAVMKCCKDGMSEKEICDKYPDCDHKKLKELCKDCKDDMKDKEKTDESLNSLKSSLRNKMEEVMEAGRYASTSSMPKKSAPVLDNEGVNGYEDYMVGEEEETDEAVLDEAELDEMAEMMRMAGLVSEEEDETERDDHAEKAGREVAHDMEYDDGHDAEDDDHDEKEGRHVAKDIEFDEKEHEAMKSILQKLMK